MPTHLIFFFFGGASPVIEIFGPGCSVAGQIYKDGSKAGQIFKDGVRAGQGQHDGAKSGQEIC